MPRYTQEQRAQIAGQAAGKIVASLEGKPDDGGYWVMTFTDDSEIAFRFVREQCAQIAEQVPGKTVASLGWEPGGVGYWMMTFTDESQIAFRFMAELRLPVAVLACHGSTSAESRLPVPIRIIRRTKAEPQAVRGGEAAPRGFEPRFAAPEAAVLPVKRKGIVIT